MNALLAYPELPLGYRIEGYPSVGYEAWLALTQWEGSVRAKTAVCWVFAPDNARGYDGVVHGRDKRLRGMTPNRSGCRNRGGFPINA